MNFDFSEGQKELGRHARRFLSERCDTGKVRAILDGPEPYDRELYRELGGLGFLGAAIPERYGGVGLGMLELCVIAEELGRSCAPVPVASSIYLGAEALLLAGNEEQKRTWLPQLANGEAIATVAMAETSGPVGPAALRATVAGGRLSGVKVPVADGDVADVALVAAWSEGAVGLFLADLSGAGVRREPLESIDPTRSLARLAFDGCPVEPLGAPGDGWSLTERLLDRAAVLVAFEQLGGADRALEMARDYALERMAFGRQIGSFQAIKHMLADMYVAATLARSNAYYGAWALSTDAPELPVAAATARVSATKAFRRCATDGIQVHGGIGFTWEADCHLYYRRAGSLGLMLGSLPAWEDRLVDRLRSRGALAA